MIFQKFFITLFICQLSILCFSQLDRQDSLKVRKLDKEARSNMMKDKQKALSLCEEAIELSKDDSEMGLYPMTTKALVHFQHGEKEESVDIMNKVISIAKEIGNDKSLSSAYRNLGQIEEYTGSFDAAIQNYMLANEAYSRSSEYDGHPNFYMAIADLHFRLKNIANAKENYRRGLSMAPIWQDDKLVAEFETKLAKLFLTDGEIDSASYYANRADTYFTSAGLFGTVNDPKEVLADIAIEMGNLDRGINYYEDLMKLLVEKEETRRIAHNAQKLGAIQIKKGKFNDALKTFHLSLEANEKLKSPAVNDDYNMLAYIYDQLGDYQKAFEFQKKYSEGYEEVLTAEKLEKINDLQIKYDTEKKDRMNEKLSFDIALKEKENKIVSSNLRTRNRTLIALSVIFLLLLGFAFLIYNRRKVLQQNKMLKLEQKLLKTQMNPHFISNALMSAQGYIYENQPKKASSYLTKIARLARLVLEYSRKETISLDDEIAIIENYLLVQQERYENFDFELIISEDLDPEDIYLPPMLTQPFVENSIEHGIQNLSYRGFVRIEFKGKNDNQLQVSVSDNGVGMTSTNELNENHTSLSSEIVNERLKNLAAYYKQKLQFSISNNFTGANHGDGTKVVLNLPISE